MEPFYYLFANPSFLSGIARTLDLGGHYDAYNFSVTTNEADAQELRDDWAAVLLALRESWVQLAHEDREFMHDLAVVANSPLLESLGETDGLKEAPQAR
jgi:hypothetical protein